MTRTKTIICDLNDYYDLLYLLRIKEYYTNYYQVINIDVKCSRCGIPYTDIITIKYKDKENE